MGLIASSMARKSWLAHLFGSAYFVEYGVKNKLIEELITAKC